MELIWWTVEEGDNFHRQVNEIFLNAVSGLWLVEALVEDGKIEGVSH